MIWLLRILRIRPKPQSLFKVRSGDVLVVTFNRPLTEYAADRIRAKGARFGIVVMPLDNVDQVALMRAPEAGQ